MAPDLLTRFVVRWSDPDPRHVPLLKQAGVEVAIMQPAVESFAAACRTAGIEALPASAVPLAGLKELPHAPAGRPVALTEGLWPGITRGPSVAGRGDETASASRDPWIDANGFWFAWLRALHPSRPALLAYQPDVSDRMVPFESAELGLIEAWFAGGNYLLAPEPRYRKALLAGDAKALEAWNQLGRTASWLKQHRALFGQPVSPRVTALVEDGDVTAELANLMYRRNVSPALAPASAPPAPDPERVRVLVAVDIQKPAATARSRILAHAEAGASVILNGDWWRSPTLKPVRQQEDREFYALGRGQVVAYKEPIADPSEFAMDVIDILAHRNRAVRLWSAPSAIGLMTGKGTLLVANYGAPTRDSVQVRVGGHYTRARLLRPGRAEEPLKCARRGPTTEIFLPQLTRAAVAVFE